MRFCQILFCITVCCGLSSCVSDSRKVLTRIDFESVACMDVGHQDLNTRQWTAVKSAAADVCDIFQSSEFRSQISTKSWLASCEMVNGSADTISGSDLFAFLTRGHQRFSVYAHKLHDAEGETDNDEANPDNNRITIDPELIEGWYSPTDTVRSQLINVIAHEYVHILSDRFLDYDDQAPAGCSDDLLASYGTGDIVEIIWLRQHKK